MKQCTRYSFILVPAVRWASLAFCLLSTGCGKSGSAQNSLSRSEGSDTMLNLAQGWAEEYGKVAPDVEVEVSGGGSGAGVPPWSGAQSTSTTLAADETPEEIEEARKNTGRNPKKPRRL